MHAGGHLLRLSRLRRQVSARKLQGLCGRYSLQTSSADLIKQTPQPLTGCHMPLSFRPMRLLSSHHPKGNHLSIKSLNFRMAFSIFCSSHEKESAKPLKMSHETQRTIKAGNNASLPALLLLLILYISSPIHYHEKILYRLPGNLCSHDAPATRTTPRHKRAAVWPHQHGIARTIKHP